MSPWKAQDQEVTATNDLMEIEDLTLTTPSPLQRLLNDDEEQEKDQTDEEEDEAEEDIDEEEEDEDDDDDGNDKWITPKVAGAGGAGFLAGGLLTAGALKMWKSSPEKRFVIVAEAKLTAAQKTELDKDPKVEYAEGTHIVSTYKTLKAFTDANPVFAAITVAKAGETDNGTYFKCGETLLRSTADNKWEVLTTAPAKAEENGGVKLNAGNGTQNPAPKGEPKKPVAETDIEKTQRLAAEKAKEEAAAKKKAAAADKEKEPASGGADTGAPVETA